jgi:hypothetical protein
VDPLPAQEPQVFRLFMVRPVTLSVLTVRERGGGLMPGRVRGVLILSFVDFATIGCEVAIVGFIWSGSWGLLLMMQVGVKLHCGELYKKRRKRRAVCLYIRAVFRQRATWMPLIKTGDRSPCGGRSSTFFALRLDDDRAGFHPSGLVIRCCVGSRRVLIKCEHLLTADGKLVAGRQADRQARMNDQGSDVIVRRAALVQHSTTSSSTRERDNGLISNRARPRRPSTGIETRPRMEPVRLYITVLLETVPGP